MPFPYITTIANSGPANLNENFNPWGLPILDSCSTRLTAYLIFWFCNCLFSFLFRETMSSLREGLWLWHLCILFYFSLIETKHNACLIAGDRSIFVERNRSVNDFNSDTTRSSSLKPKLLFFSSQ